MAVPDVGNDKAFKWQFQEPIRQSAGDHHELKLTFWR
jgi:hypothetical protein